MNEIVVEGSGEEVLVDALVRAIQLALHNETVLFVDCGNSFNPYFIQKYCGNTALAREVLSRIRISRPFTIHQIRRLLQEVLLPELRRENAKHVIVYALTDLFEDKAIGFEERKAVLEQTLRAALELRERTKAEFHFYLDGNNGFNEAVREAFDGEDSVF